MSALTNARNIIGSLYLGDRYIKRITVDCERRQVKVVIDRISWIDSKTATWNFNSEGDMIDGALVFSGVSNFETKQVGALANDEISSITCVASEEVIGAILFNIEACGVDAKAVSHDIDIRIVAESLAVSNE